MPELKKQLADFKKFILRGNVVDLAVAVAVGAAFTSIVTALSNSLIKPMIAALGSPNIGQGLGFSIRGGNLSTSTFVDFGTVISAIINFLIVAAVVFFFVVQPINKFMARVKPSDESDKPSERSCPACFSAIPAEASRCKYCTTRFDGSGRILKDKSSKA